MDKHELACNCGTVALELSGDAFFTTECHCNSCREAASRLAARGMTEGNGGTRYVLYRKDRARILRGQDALHGYRLTAGAPTRRVVASCCNTPVFLEFQSGHWLSLYSSLWQEGRAPPPKIRTMTQDRTEDEQPDQSIPHGKKETFGFYARLLGAWIAMGFRAPTISVKAESVLD